MDIAAPFGNFGGQLGKTINNGIGISFQVSSAANTARVGPLVQERQKGKVAVVPNALLVRLATPSQTRQNKKAVCVWRPLDGLSCFGQGLVIAKPV